jgi:transcriptional regulator with XRE-family HTH domain
LKRSKRIAADFSEILVDVMKKHNLSQIEIAHHLDVSQQTISSWKLGTRSPQSKHRRTLLAMHGGRLVPEIPEKRTIPPFEGDCRNESLDHLRALLDDESRALLNSVADRLFETRNLRNEIDVAHAKSSFCENILSGLPCAVWTASFISEVFTVTCVSPKFLELAGHDKYEPDLWTKTVVAAADRGRYLDFHEKSLAGECADTRIEYDAKHGKTGKTVRLLEIRSCKKLSRRTMTVHTVVLPA